MSLRCLLSISISIDVLLIGDPRGFGAYFTLVGFAHAPAALSILFLFLTQLGGSLLLRSLVQVRDDIV